MLLARAAQYLRRSLERPGSDIVAALVGHTSLSGVPVNPETAIRVSAVYACVALIAETIGTLPIHVYRDRAGNRERVDDHPAARVLIERPNPTWTRRQLIEAIVASMLLHGNAYVGLERDPSGYATRAWLIDPRRVRARSTGRGSLVFEVDGTVWPHPDVLLHFPALVLNEDGLGLSPIAAAREAVGLAIAAEDAAAAWWSNAGVPSAVLQAASQLTDEQARRLLARWAEMYSGPRKVGRVAVLDSGVEYKPLTISARDLQFLETRRFQVAEIARLFRVPPHMIADVERSTSWGAGIEQQTIAFVQYTLRPWVVRLEEVLSQDLLLTRGLYVRFALDGLLRGDTQSRWQAYRIAREIGVMSANEVRVLEDLPRIETPSADAYFVPANWVATGGGGGDREANAE